MEQGGAGWQRGRWEPSAPESFVLLYGAGAEDRQALKLALLELVARGKLALRDVEEEGFLRNRSVAVLYRGSGQEGAPRPLRALIEVFDRAAARLQRPDGGVPVAKLAEEVGRRYGSSRGYVDREVIPALQERGLYERRPKRFLGLVPYSDWGPTRAGEAARASLRAEMDLGEAGFGEWVDRNPNRALAYLGLMGPAVLLMTPLHPDIQRLREQHAASSASGDGDSSPDQSGPDEPQGSDFGGGDFDASSSGFSGGEFDASALDPSLDPSAFDGIGEAFSAIDAGVDAGGGGDGGGGDGGGGGD